MGFLVKSLCLGVHSALKDTLRGQRLNKFSISLEIVNPDLQNSPQKLGVWWVARLKFSISLEMFNPSVLKILQR